MIYFQQLRYRSKYDTKYNIKVLENTIDLIRDYEEEIYLSQLLESIKTLLNQTILELLSQLLESIKILLNRTILDYK